MSDNKLKELPACPVETTLTLIGDKWKVLILRDLKNSLYIVRRVASKLSFSI